MATHPRHFVVTFHDETFECIARTIDGYFTSQPLDQVVAELVAPGVGRRSQRP